MWIDGIIIVNMYTLGVYWKIYQYHKNNKINVSQM